MEGPITTTLGFIIFGYGVIAALLLFSPGTWSFIGKLSDRLDYGNVTTWIIMPLMLILRVTSWPIRLSGRIWDDIRRLYKDWLDNAPMKPESSGHDPR